MTTAYDSYIKRITNAWQGDDDEEELRRKRIIQHGERVHVDMAAMDSVQQAIHGQTDTSALDERVRHTIDGNRAVLDAARRDADRVQALADHFTAKRKQQDAALSGGAAYDQMVKDVSSAWQHREVAA